MRMTFITSLCALGALSTAAWAMAETSERQPPEELAKYTVTGETESCLSLTSIRQSKPLDDYNILFMTRGGDTYLNQLSSRCSGLGFEKSFTYATSLNKLCNTDIIRVISTGGGGTFTRGSCGLGTFEKVEEKPDAPDAG